MAGPSPFRTAGRRGRPVALVALLLALVLLAGPLAPAGAAQASDPRLGDAAPYFGPEGDEVATITVEEIIDPFRSYDANNPPQRGYHYVLLRLSVENTGDRPLTFDPSTVALQDSLGFLAYPQYVNRGSEAAEIDPDLAYGEIAAGTTARGVALYQVFNGAELSRVVFQPDRERLVILADLRSEAATDAAAPTEATPGAGVGEQAANGATQDPQLGQSGAAPTNATLYENAAFGFGLAYDAETWEAAESADGLTLTNGVSTVQITGSEVLPTDAPACVDEVASDLALTSSRQDYALLEGDGGEPARAGDAVAAFALFGYTGRTGEQMFEQIACLTLPAERGVILLLQNGPLAAVAEETGAVEALLEGLSVT